MSNRLVKMTVTADGEPIDAEDQKWCLSNPSPYADTNRVTCSDEVLDSDSHARWEEKHVKRGGITCHKCIENVKAFKSIKL